MLKLPQYYILYVASHITLVTTQGIVIMYLLCDRQHSHMLSPKGKCETLRLNAILSYACIQNRITTCDDEPFQLQFLYFPMAAGNCN